MLIPSITDFSSAIPSATCSVYFSLSDVFSTALIEKLFDREEFSVYDTASTTNSRRKIQIICDRKFSSTTSSPPHPSFERQKDEIENCAVAPVWKKCNTRVSHATNRWIERKVIWVWVARENV